MGRPISDFPRGGTVPHVFNTYAPDNTLITFAGSPTLAAYQQGTTSPAITAGITLTVDVGGVTGKHAVAIVLTNAAWVAGYNYDVMITAGTVAGISRVGSKLFTFGIESQWNGWVFEGTAQGAGAQQLTLATGQILADSRLLGNRIYILRNGDPTADGQERTIVTTTLSSEVAGLDRPFDVVPTGTIIYRMYPGSLPGTSAEIQAGLATSSALAAAQADVTTLLTSDRAYAKNVAVTNKVFPMRLVDGTAATGKTVLVQLSKDGAAFASVTANAGIATEIGGGWYKINFSQAEFNADELAVKATATGCLQTDFMIRTTS